MKIEIYTSPPCGYCIRAKKLLQNKNIHFIEHSIFFHPKKKKEMIERSGGKMTVPLIFINNEYFTDSDGLQKLQDQGLLDDILHMRKK